MTGASNPPSGDWSSAEPLPMMASTIVTSTLLFALSRGLTGDDIKKATGLSPEQIAGFDARLPTIPRQRS